VIHGHSAQVSHRSCISDVCSAYTTNWNKPLTANGPQEFVLLENLTAPASICFILLSTTVWLVNKDLSMSEESFHLILIFLIEMKLGQMRW